MNTYICTLLIRYVSKGKERRPWTPRRIFWGSFFRAHVILLPAACRREIPSHSWRHHFRGLQGLPGWIIDFKFRSRSLNKFTLEALFKTTQAFPEESRESPRRPKGSPGQQISKTPQGTPREPNLGRKEATGTPKTPVGSQRNGIYPKSPDQTHSDHDDIISYTRY